MTPFKKRKDDPPERKDLEREAAQELGETLAWGRAAEPPGGGPPGSWGQGSPQQPRGASPADVPGSSWGQLSESQEWGSPRPGSEPPPSGGPAAPPGSWSWQGGSSPQASHDESAPPTGSAPATASPERSWEPPSEPERPRHEASSADPIPAPWPPQEPSYEPPQPERSWQEAEPRPSWEAPEPGGSWQAPASPAGSSWGGLSQFGSAPPPGAPPSQPPASRPGIAPVSFGPPGELGDPSGFPTGPGAGGPEERDWLTIDEEKDVVTGMAVQDLAAQRGAAPEQIAQRPDAVRAAAMRDRALQQYLQRKQEMERRRREQGGGRHDGESK